MNWNRTALLYILPQLCTFPPEHLHSMNWRHFKSGSHFRGLATIWLTSCFTCFTGVAFPCYFMTNENSTHRPTLAPVHMSGRVPLQSTRHWILLCFKVCMDCGWMWDNWKKKGCPGVRIWCSVMRTGTWDIKSINMSGQSDILPLF